MDFLGGEKPLAGENGTTSELLDIPQSKRSILNSNKEGGNDAPSQPQLILTDIEELVLELLRCLSCGVVPDFNVVHLRLQRNAEAGLACAPWEVP